MRSLKPFVQLLTGIEEELGARDTGLMLASLDSALHLVPPVAPASV